MAITTKEEFKAYLDGVYESVIDRLVDPLGNVRPLDIAVTIRYVNDSNDRRWITARTFPGQKELVDYLLDAAYSASDWHFDPKHWSHIEVLDDSDQ